jgi:hypothetical protein
MAGCCETICWFHRMQGVPVPGEELSACREALLAVFSWSKFVVPLHLLGTAIRGWPALFLSVVTVEVHYNAYLPCTICPYQCAVRHADWSCKKESAMKPLTTWPSKNLHEMAPSVDVTSIPIWRISLEGELDTRACFWSKTAPVFLGFPVSKSECWDGSQVSQVATACFHLVLQT